MNCVAAIDLGQIVVVGDVLYAYGRTMTWSPNELTTVYDVREDYSDDLGDVRVDRTSDDATLHGRSLFTCDVKDNHYVYEIVTCRP